MVKKLIHLENDGRHEETFHWKEYATGTWAHEEMGSASLVIQESQSKATNILKGLNYKEGENNTWTLLNLVNATRKAKEENKKHKWSCYRNITSTDTMFYTFFCFHSVCFDFTSLSEYAGLCPALFNKHCHEYFFVSLTITHECNFKIVYNIHCMDVL